MPVSLQSKTANIRKDAGVHEINKKQQEKIAGVSTKPLTQESLAELDQLAVEED